jgi:hypothetical protein
MPELAGKVAVTTGAASGIGLAVASPDMTASIRSAACSTGKVRHSNVLLKSAGHGYRSSGHPPRNPAAPGQPPARNAGLRPTPVI